MSNVIDYECRNKEQMNQNRKTLNPQDNDDDTQKKVFVSLYAFVVNKHGEIIYHNNKRKICFHDKTCCHTYNKCKLEKVVMTAIKIKKEYGEEEDVFNQIKENIGM